MKRLFLSDYPNQIPDKNFGPAYVIEGANAGILPIVWSEFVSRYTPDSDHGWSACFFKLHDEQKCKANPGRQIYLPEQLKTHLKILGYDVISLKEPTHPSIPTPAPSYVSLQPTAPTPSKLQVIDKPSSSGTGFFVSSDGSILTNAHVVEGCSIIRATTSKGKTASARILARDIRNDLALLKSELSVVKPAAFRMTMRQGEGVEAFGYPLTSLLAKSGSFTLGNISALAGIGDDSRYLQMSAPVQPGNSGGPLLDQYGNVVGIVSAKLNALKLMVSTNGDIPENVNFAIKSPIATSFLTANGVDFSVATGTQQIRPEDLADQARDISVYIDCN